MSSSNQRVRLSVFVATSAVLFGLALLLAFGHLASQFGDACIGRQESTTYKERYSLSNFATQCVYHRRSGEVSRVLPPGASLQQALAWSAIGVGAAAAALILTVGLSLSIGGMLGRRLPRHQEPVRRAEVDC